MDLERFKTQVIVLDELMKNEFRKKYIDKFINTNSEGYQKQIQVKINFLDGYCYLGYLWDYLKNATIIDEEYIERLIKNNDQVYVFWDIHSCERIFIKDYWKFEKDAVLQMDFEVLQKNEKFLPEDIYIFNQDFTWTLIKTHEEIDGKRYCLKSGNI